MQTLPNCERLANRTQELDGIITLDLAGVTKRKKCVHSVHRRKVCADIGAINSHDFML